MASFLDGLMRQVHERVSRWRKRRRDIAELYGLDERSLADMGLTRADIPFVVYGHRSERRALQTAKSTRTREWPPRRLRTHSMKRHP